MHTGRTFQPSHIAAALIHANTTSIRNSYLTAAGSNIRQNFYFDISQTKFHEIKIDRIWSLTDAGNPAKNIFQMED